MRPLLGKKLQLTSFQLLACINTIRGRKMSEAASARRGNDVFIFQLESVCILWVFRDVYGREREKKKAGDKWK